MSKLKTGQEIGKNNLSRREFMGILGAVALPLHTARDQQVSTRPRIVESLELETNPEENVENWAHKEPFNRDLKYDPKTDANITGTDVEYLLGFLVIIKKLKWGGTVKKPWPMRFGPNAADALQKYQESVMKENLPLWERFKFPANGELNKETRALLNYLFKKETSDLRKKYPAGGASRDEYLFRNIQGIIPLNLIDDPIRKESDKALRKFEQQQGNPKQKIK